MSFIFNLIDSLTLCNTYTAERHTPTTQSTPPSLITELEHAPTEDLIQFLQGEQSLTNQGVLDLLKGVSDLKIRLAQNAGVGEGYTIEEHSLRVMEGFSNEFCTEENRELLEKIGLTPEDFRLFLALHDIGKGQAVEEEGLDATPKRKEKELRYCQKVICTIGEALSIPKEKILIFLALLKDDNIGDLLKQPYITNGYSVTIAKQLMKEAKECNVEPTLFTKLKILFHMIDASSYPMLRRGIFAVGSEKQVTIVGTKYPKVENYKTYLAHRITLIHRRVQERSVVEKDPLSLATEVSLSKEKKITINDLLHARPSEFSTQNVHSLRRARQKLKKQRENLQQVSLVYHLFSHKLKQIQSYKLLFRIHGIIKAYTIKEMGRNNILQSNQDSNQVKSKIIPNKNKVFEIVKNEIPVNEIALQKLEPIKWLHGTNSATLALMHASGYWKLTALGNLVKKGVAPMCGEVGKGGFTYRGMNRVFISTETIRDIERVQKYATSFTFDPEKIAAPLMFPFSSVHSNTEEFAHDMLLFRMEDEEGFVKLFSPHFKRMQTNIKKAKERLEEKWQNLQHTLENKKIPSELRVVVEMEAYWDIKCCLDNLADLFCPKNKLEKVENRNLEHKNNKSCLYDKEIEKYNRKFKEKEEQVKKGKRPTRSHHFRSLEMKRNKARKHTKREMYRSKKEYEMSSPLKQKVTPDTVGATRVRLMQLKQWDETLLQMINLPLLKQFAKEEEQEALTLYQTITDTIEEAERTPTCAHKYATQGRLPSLAKLEQAVYYMRVNRSCRYVSKQLNLPRLLSCKEGRQRLSLLKKHIKKEMEGIINWYKPFYEVADTNRTTSPLTSKQKKWIHSPFPVIFGSTTEKATPTQGHHEFAIRHQIGLGKEGIDVLITQTKEEREKVLKVLPERLIAEMKIYTYKELQQNQVPLFHAVEHIQI